MRLAFVCDFFAGARVRGGRCRRSRCGLAFSSVSRWELAGNGAPLRALSAAVNAILLLVLSPRPHISQTHPSHVTSPSLNPHPVKNPQLTGTPLYPSKTPYIYTPSPSPSPPNQGLLSTPPIPPSEAPHLVVYPGVTANVGRTYRSELYTLKFSPVSAFSRAWSARWRRTRSRSSSAWRSGMRWTRPHIFSRASSLGTTSVSLRV